MFLGVPAEALGVERDSAKAQGRKASDAYRKRVGGAIREARAQRGLTQADVAKAINVDITTISGIERGANVPTLQTVEAIANALGVGLDRLIGRPAPDAAASPPATPPNAHQGSLEEQVASLRDDLITIGDTARMALRLAQQHEADLAPRRSRKAAQ
jgi:transcriptional regulator with XRE-family HTH domain